MAMSILIARYFLISSVSVALKATEPLSSVKHKNQLDIVGNI